MNKILFISLAFSTIIVSCGQRTTSKNNDFKNNIVLGAFNDMVSTPTFDETLLKDVPEFIDLSSEMTPARNQSDRGVCTVFSTMGMIENSLKKDLGIDVNLSEEYLNYTSKKSGIFRSTEGSTVTENIQAIYRGGILLEDDWSFQSSWFKKDLPCEDFKASNKETPKICFSHNSPNNKVLARTIDSKNIKFFALKKDTNEIIKFLAKNKRSLTMSLNVNFKGWPASGETDYNEELRLECLKAPSECGGHSVTLTGYDMNKKIFMFKNSWGKKWGNNGYGTIPFSAVDKYVSGLLYYSKVVGEVKIPDTLSSPINVAKLEVSTSENIDKSLNINIESEINETNGKMLLISSYIVKKHKDHSKQLPSDTNSEAIRLYDVEDQKIIGENYLKISSYLIPKEESNIVINPGDKPGMVVPASMLSTSEVKALQSSGDFDLLLRTTIYVHDDDVGYKLLKRTFSPL